MRVTWSITGNWVSSNTSSVLSSCSSSRASSLLNHLDTGFIGIIYIHTGSYFFVSWKVVSFSLRHVTLFCSIFTKNFPLPLMAISNGINPVSAKSTNNRVDMFFLATLSRAPTVALAHIRSRGSGAGMIVSCNSSFANNT